MPHQAHGSECNRNQINYLAIGETIKWLLAFANFDGVKFRNDSRWRPQSLVAAAVLWSWSGERNLLHRFAKARKIVAKMFAWLPEPPSSYQAFTKMLVRWSVVLLAPVVAGLRQRMLECLICHGELCGYVVFGVDGSRFELPRSEGNEQKFSAARKKKKGKKKRRRSPASEKKINSPQMWVTTMWHAASGLPWDWRRGPSDSSEREHLLQMIPALPAKSMVTADAGFVGYEYWRALQQAGHQMLIRVGSNVHFLKKLGYAREYDGIVYSWPGRQAKKTERPLVLRLIVLHNGKHPVYLATNVLARTKLTDKQAATIYKARWGVELFYRGFKQTFDRRKLRSHKPEHAEVEFDWSLVGLWMICLRTLCQLAAQGVEPSRLSVAGALRAFQDPMKEWRCRPDPGEDHWTLMEAAVIDPYQRTDKTSRDYPRKNKKEKQAGKPEIQDATDEQRRQAHRIKNLNTEKG